QRVVVRDNQAPTITCPADVTVNVNSCGCFAPGMAPGNSTADVCCCNVTITSNAPAQFPTGTNLVTWTATDSSGNTAICQQRVVRSEERRVGKECRAGWSANDKTNTCFATGVELGRPTAKDNCGTVMNTS